MVRHDTARWGTAGTAINGEGVMARFTKALRQEIIRSFCQRRNSDFDAADFEKEVRETGEDHPAYSWFEWSVDKAATEYRVWQARAFATGLRVSFKVENIGRDGTIRVHQVEMPMLLSPMDGRDDGGGYYLLDRDNPEHMAELCRQAVTDLARWLRRYEAALLHVGGSVAPIEKQLKLLESATKAEAA
jgi:hypothetical protein